jgi:hypothetical protein
MKIAWQKVLALSSYACPEAKVVLRLLRTEHPEVFKVIEDFAARKKGGSAQQHPTPIAASRSVVDG